MPVTGLSSLGCGKWPARFAALAPCAWVRFFLPRRDYSTASGRRRTGSLAKNWRSAIRESASNRIRCGFKDGNIYTSAGISAGIDLALAWVEEDCGAAVAHEVALGLVLFLRRPGGQTQYSVSLAAQASEMKAIQELQVWMAENLSRDLSVEILAQRAAMSPRNFQRVFLREVGKTPSHYVQELRLEAAHRQLDRTDRGLKRIALDCGFGNAEVMRRAFVRLIGITPDRYRRTLNVAKADS
jgi:transcriptional regulator GlxA family with amidase domain